MSKSVLLKSSIAKKYWMALTGLFLCLFLVGHLIGNMQLILKTGEEGRRAFNEYAYFMQHNPLIKVMSYVTYLSILFHAIDGIALAVQNKKARPVGYAMSNANANSKSFARQMAILGSIIFIFIVTHMVNFWAKMHFDGLKLHKIEISNPMNPQAKQELYVTTNGSFVPVEQVEIKDETMFYAKGMNIKMGEGYKDLHSAVEAFFTGKKTKEMDGNGMAIVAVLLYTVSMIVLSFHLMHGFSSAFQSLGLRHKRYTPGIELFGKIFSIVVPALFAIIPIIIYYKSL